jgi:hypothetical protein
LFKAFLLRFVMLEKDERMVYPGGFDVVWMGAASALYVCVVLLLEK